MGLGHYGLEQLVTAVRWGQRVVKGCGLVEPVAFGILPLDGDSALIGGGSAVSHSFDWIFEIHGLVCNLPGPGLGGGSAGSVLLERRNHQGELWGIQRFQVGVRAFCRFRCRIQVYRRVRADCLAIRRLGILPR